MNRVFVDKKNGAVEDLSLPRVDVGEGVPAALARMRALVEELPRHFQDSMSALVGQLNAAVIKERVAFQKLFDALPDGYVVTDFECKVEQANAAACSLLRIESHAIYGESLLKFLCERSRLLIAQRLRLAAIEGGEGGRWTNVPARLVFAGATERRICLRMLVLRGEKGTTIRWMLRRV
jgi:PAS domain-containing protein